MENSFFFCLGSKLCLTRTKMFQTWPFTHGNAYQTNHSKINSPQQEDASGRQVFEDMWAFHSSGFDQGCLHHCQPGTRRWPHYGLHCRCRREEELMWSQTLALYLEYSEEHSEIFKTCFRNSQTLQSSQLTLNYFNFDAKNVQNIVQYMTPNY